MTFNTIKNTSFAAANVWKGITATVEVEMQLL